MRNLLILVLLAGSLHSEVPDLTGTYDVATLTPLFRPRPTAITCTYLERRASGSPKKRLKEWPRPTKAATRLARRLPREETGLREQPEMCGYNAFWIDRGEDAFTLNGQFRTSIVTMPANGQRPSFTPVAQARMAELYKGYRRGNDGTAWWLDQEGPGPYDNMEQRPKAERCLLGFSSTAAPDVAGTLQQLKAHRANRHPRDDFSRDGS